MASVWNSVPSGPSVTTGARPPLGGWLGGADVTVTAELSALAGTASVTPTLADASVPPLAPTVPSVVVVLPPGPLGALGAGDFVVPQAASSAASARTGRTKRA